MGSFKITLGRSAEEELRRSPFPFRRQIVQRINKLKSNPCPVEAQAMEAGIYRLNVHGWFVVYEVDQAAGTVTIFRIYH